MITSGYAKTKKYSKNSTRRLFNVFRFIDDFAAINDGGEHERSYNEMYHPELETLRGHVWTFLINFEDKKFSMNLYDKRDVFYFSIVRMS